MLELLSPMASVLVSWFLLYWLFSGIGALALGHWGSLSNLAGSGTMASGSAGF